MERFRWISEGRKRPLSVLVPALLLTLLAPPASAGDTGPIYGPPPPRESRPLTLVDPIDGHTFEWQLPIGSNALGGYDSDGCTYAKGEQPRASGVATSPTSLYSARAERFARTLSDEQKATLLEQLSTIGADVDDARALTPAGRYELAAAVAEHLGDPAFDVAELYLIGAWTVRDTIVGFFPGVRGAGDAWNKLEEVMALAAQVDEPRPRTRALFDMARLAHRGGFLHERNDFLAKLDTFEDAGLHGKEKRTEFRRRVERESDLLRNARRWYRKGLDSGEGDGSDRAVARLMVADLSRRLGELDEARTQAEGVRMDQAAPPEVVMQAEDVLQALTVQAASAIGGAGESK